MEPLTIYQTDVLAEVLRSVHIQTTLYCRAKLGAPWGLHIEIPDYATFHIVIGGNCWLSIEGVKDHVFLSEGDLVILPMGHHHTLFDQAQSPVIRLADLVSIPPEVAGTFDTGGEGPQTTLICGGFQVADRNTNPLFSALPAFIHIKNDNDRSLAWLQTIVDLVVGESSLNNPGADIIITRLSEVLFVQAIRTFVSRNMDTSAGWLTALKDPQMSLALRAIHHQPTQDWTVDSLATLVGMSRTAFATKFRQLVGDPPLRYIVRWRLNLATGYLRTSTKKLAEIAELVGYSSESSFSKAFKRYMGTTPDMYRRNDNAPYKPLSSNS